MFEYKDGWIIADNDFNYETEYTKASVYAMCNGYMGNRGTLEEMDPVKGLYTGNYINGIYDAPSNLLREREIVNIQDWCSINLWMDGERFDLSTGTVSYYKRWMDLREAVLHREVKWQSPKGKAIALKTERFVSMTELHHGLIRWELEALDDCRIVIESGMNACVSNKHMYHFRDFIACADEKFIYLETVTKEMDYHIGTACADMVDATAGVRIDKRLVRKNRKYICNRYSARLRKGQTVSIQKTAAVYSSRDCERERIKEVCAAGLNEIEKAGYRNIKDRHIKRWNELWQPVDMVIEGDDKAQIGIRFSIYHLLNSAPYHSSDISYPARSLSGQDHRGSVFWDTEIFIAPFFIYNLPEVAKNMLIYRYKTLDGARRKAAKLGYSGAYYAWESHETGDDKCHSSVFKYARTQRYMINHFWDAQIHVSADISYCIWQYYETTGDTGFIKDYGAEIVLEIARFYANRTVYDKRRKTFVIKGVLGPDEYHEMIDNNAFTNVMAKEAIAIAFKILGIMKKLDEKSCNRLFEKIGLSARELEQWQQVHDKLFIPSPDMAANLIEQFTGYFKLEDCSVSEVKSRRFTPSEYLGGKFGLCSKTRIIKQADVIMLLYLMRERYSQEIKKANWEYYEPRTEHGSSLSPMAYALVAADIDRMEWSYRFFMHTAFMDLEAKGLYRNHGVHPCSLAGAWLTVLHGYSGITFREDGIHWRNPHMPPGWNRLEFVLKWHGHDIRFIYNDGRYEAKLANTGSDVRIPFFINGGRELLAPGQPVSVICRERGK